MYSPWMWLTTKAHNKYWRSKLQSRAPPFRCVTPIEESASDAGVQLIITVDWPPARQSTSTSAIAPITTTVEATKSKMNPHVKPGVDKWYRCGEPGYKSNEYLRGSKSIWGLQIWRRGRSLDWRTKWFWLCWRAWKTTTYVHQRLLCNQKAPDTMERYQVFYLRCSVKKKSEQPHH